MSIFDEKQPEIEAALQTADSIAFDGCHKIYVLMDESQTIDMVAFGYNEPNRMFRVGDKASETLKALSTDEAFAKLKDWFDESCGLRFISAVRTVTGNPNEGFICLISQWEGDDDEGYEEDEDEE